MIDKIGHVKNPLTVIAMFAGLAEVSGTAVLPFVEEEAQLFYVKFLSLFPCLIVGLFFYTLWRYPRNLYALSDYSNENNFVSALGFLIAQKTEQEIEEAGVQLEASVPIPDVTIEASPAEDAGDAPLQSSSAELSSENVNLDEQSKLKNETQAETQHKVDLARYHSNLLNRLSQSTSWVLRELSSENRMTFVTDVSPSGQPGIVFDAVGSDNGFTIVVEVKYASGPKFNSAAFSKSIKDARAYFETLPKDKRAQFGMILAVVAGEQLTTDEIESLKRRIRIRAETQISEFSVQVRVFKYRELSDTYANS